MYHDTQSFKEEFVFPVSLLILRFYFHRQTEEFLNSGSFYIPLKACIYHIFNLKNSPTLLTFARPKTAQKVCLKNSAAAWQNCILYSATRPFVSLLSCHGEFAIEINN